MQTPSQNQFEPLIPTTQKIPVQEQSVSSIPETQKKENFIEQSIPSNTSAQEKQINQNIGPSIPPPQNNPIPLPEQFQPSIPNTRDQENLGKIQYNYTHRLSFISFINLIS